MVVVPHSNELEVAELDLRLALVAMVAGTRPPVSPRMVRNYLNSFLGIIDVSVHSHDPEDFIVRFARSEDRDLTLRAVVPNTPFTLIWHPWRRTSLASAGAFHYQVLVGMTRVPLHVKNTAMAQAILGTPAPTSSPRRWMSRRQKMTGSSFVAAWCLHPSLVPDEKTIFIPEPNVRIPRNALYLDADEVILNKLPGLRYLVHLRIIEYLDWSMLPPSYDDGGYHRDDDSDGSDDNNHNRRHPGIDDIRTVGSRHRTY